jgi:hypothetical protein
LRRLSSDESNYITAETIVVDGGGGARLPESPLLAG